MDMVSMNLKMGKFQKVNGKVASSLEKVPSLRKNMNTLVNLTARQKQKALDKNSGTQRISTKQANLSKDEPMVMLWKKTQGIIKSISENSRKEKNMAKGC